MSRDHFGHPLEVPQRKLLLTRQMTHEGVNGFVEQQMSTVVIEGLVVHPEFRANLTAVKRSQQVGPHDPRIHKTLSLADDVAGHVVPTAIAGGWQLSEVLFEKRVHLIDKRNGNQIKVSGAVPSQTGRPQTALVDIGSRIDDAELSRPLDGLASGFLRL